MSYARTESVTITTAADGSATAYLGTGAPFNGKLVTLIYTKDDFADTVDFTITSETTGQNLWVESNVTASKTISPHQPTHNTSGVALLYAASGEPVDTDIYLVDERIKIVLAQGGNATSGTFRAIVA